VTAAEDIAVPEFEEKKRLAADCEALGGALTMALAQEAEPGDPCASAGSHTPFDGRCVCLRPWQIHVDPRHCNYAADAWATGTRGRVSVTRGTSNYSQHQE
jgi:hypothetical protein